MKTAHTSSGPVRFSAATSISPATVSHPHRNSGFEAGLLFRHHFARQLTANHFAEFVAPFPRLDHRVS